MALKQNSDNTENLRQAIQSFRDAIDAISFPLPCGLERMLQMEGQIEDFNVSLPLADVSPFDGLRSGADVELGKQSPDIDSQRSKTDEYRADSVQAKRVMQEGRAEGCGRHHNPGNSPGITDKERVTPLEPNPIAPDAMVETPANVNNRQVREKSGGGGGKTITPIRVSAMESIPGSSPPSPIQNRKQNLDAVKNTLVTVDKLAKSILDGDHKNRAELVHAEQENVEYGQKRRRKDEWLKAETLSARAPLCAVPEDKSSDNTGRGSHLHKENRQTGSYHGVVEEPLPPGASVFSTRQVEGSNMPDRDGCRVLSTCLVQVGRIADEILNMSAKGSTADDIIVRAQSRTSQVDNPEPGMAGTVVGAGAFDSKSKPDMKKQQSNGNFLSSKVNNVTEVVLNKSMPADSLDKDAITALVNDVLVEQARRHGVDLS